MGYEIVVIGGSAGGMSVCRQLLQALPADFPLPIAVALHVHPTMDSGRLDLFRRHCALAVLDAEPFMTMAPGAAYFAPPNYHLLVERGGVLLLTIDAKEHHCRPSIDTLFESAADAYGAATIGIVLTGANDDGARGLRAIAATGGVAIVQDPVGAQVTAMPAAAITAVPTALILPPEKMADVLRHLALNEKERTP